MNTKKFNFSFEWNMNNDRVNGVMHFFSSLYRYANDSEMCLKSFYVCLLDYTENSWGREDFTIYGMEVAKKAVISLTRPSFNNLSIWQNFLFYDDVKQPKWIFVFKCFMTCSNVKWLSHRCTHDLQNNIYNSI